MRFCDAVSDALFFVSFTPVHTALTEMSDVFSVNTKKTTLITRKSRAQKHNMQTVIPISIDLSYVNQGGHNFKGEIQGLSTTFSTPIPAMFHHFRECLRLRIKTINK